MERHRSGSARAFFLVAIAWAQLPALAAVALEDPEKLLASDGERGDNFGRSVAVSGDAMVVGSQYAAGQEPSSGAAYVFRYDEESWVEEARLTAFDGQDFDVFARAIAISGDTILVGSKRDDDNGISAGSAYVFRHDGFEWHTEAKLLASDGEVGDLFGHSVSLSGDVALIAAHGNDFYTGVVYVYRRSGADWVEEARLRASDGAIGDRFGFAVGLSGDAAVVGAPFDDEDVENSGSFYVFHHDDTGWVETAKLTVPQAEENDRLGKAVAISGDTILVGVYEDDDNGINSGTVQTFRYNGNAWIRGFKLWPGDARPRAAFGISVALAGNMALVGAFGDDDNGRAAGAAYLFVDGGLNWTQLAKLTAPDGEDLDYFGRSIALSSYEAVIGSYKDDDNGLSAGAAYLFTVPEPAAHTLATTALIALSALARRRRDHASQRPGLPWKTTRGRVSLPPRS